MSSQHTKIRLEKKLKENPQSLIFARLADIYLTEDRVDDAIQVCQAGLKGNPTYVTGHFILAKAYMLQNDLEKAESALKKVLTHDRNFIKAHKYLGDLMIKLGWENTAITHYKDILNIDPLESNILSILEKLSDEIPEAIDLPSGTTGEPSASGQESAISSGTPPGEEEWMNQIREVFPDDQSGQDSSEVTSKPPESEPPDQSSPRNSFPPPAPPPEKTADSGTAGAQNGDEITGISADESESFEPPEILSAEDVSQQPGERADSENGNSEQASPAGVSDDAEVRDDSLQAPSPLFEPSETGESGADAGFVEFDMDAIQFDDSVPDSGITVEPDTQAVIEPAESHPVSGAPETAASDVPQPPEIREPAEDQTAVGVEDLPVDSEVDRAGDSAVSGIPDSDVMNSSSSVSVPEAASEPVPPLAETDDEETLAVLDAWTDNEAETLQQQSGTPAERSHESPESGEDKTDPDVQEIVSEEEFLLEMTPAKDEEEIDLHETFDIPSLTEEESTEQALDLDIDIHDDAAAPVSAGSQDQSSEAVPPEAEHEVESATLEPPSENGTFEAANRSESTPEVSSAEDKIPEALNKKKRPSQKAPASVRPKTRPEPSDESVSSPEPPMTPKILTPTLGEIYIAQGQFDKALDIYQKLLEMHPNEKKYQEKIAFIQEKIKDLNL
jgi:tetratricopeptide (TPR) repeat protein